MVLLAGVAINLAVGENSILNKAKNSKELTIKQIIKEEIEESILAIQVEEVTKTGKLTLKKLYEELPKKNTNVEVEEYNELELKGTYTKDGKIYGFTIDKDFNVIIGEQEEKKALTFEEIQWTNGKASITITSKISNSIEYQVNATNEENWIQGNTVANLNNGDIVYARINDGTTITEIQQKEIKDEIKPEEFEITVPEDGITYESINVVTTGTTDNQTGLATYSYIAATSSNQIVKEITGQTVTEYTINELSPETEYVVYMLAYDNAGNVRKSNEVIVKTGIFVEPVQVCSGYFSGVFLDTKGDIWINSSLNNWGQLGNGEKEETINSDGTFEKVLLNCKFSDISFGNCHTLALDKEGNIWSWGLNTSGQCGIENESSECVLIPTKIEVEDNIKFTNISAGESSSLALDEDGNIWFWGSGYPGDGNIILSNVKPVKILIGDEVKFTQISSIRRHYLALDVDGNIWAWGSNRFGQIGNGKGDISGSGTYETIPVKLECNTKFVQISAGLFHSLALDVDGNVWAWGDNSYGEVGNGKYRR